MVPHQLVTIQDLLVPKDDRILNVLDAPQTFGLPEVLPDDPYALMA